MRQMAAAPLGVLVLKVVSARRVELVAGTVLLLVAAKDYRASRAEASKAAQTEPAEKGTPDMELAALQQSMAALGEGAAEEERVEQRVDESESVAVLLEEEAPGAGDEEEKLLASCDDGVEAGVATSEGEDKLARTRLGCCDADTAVMVLAGMLAGAGSGFLGTPPFTVSLHLDVGMFSISMTRQGDAQCRRRLSDGLCAHDAGDGRGDGGHRRAAGVPAVQVAQHTQGRGSCHGRVHGCREPSPAAVLARRALPCAAHPCGCVCGVCGERTAGQHAGRLLFQLSQSAGVR